MKQIIDITVTYNKQVLNTFLYSVLSADLNRNELTLNGPVGEHKCRPIIVWSDFCPTLYFIRKLNSCLDYRRLVFNNLKLFLAKSVCKKVPTLTSEVSSSDDIDGKSDETYELISIRVKLKSLNHWLAIDKDWNKLVLNLVVIRLRVEDSLSWLSTLGGAYSSLGEYDTHCAIKAGQISVSQLRLATINGDPNVVARCGIYMAYSLCQLQKKRDAVQMIRRTLHPFISNIKNCDKIVISMYSALCYRIKNSF